MEVWHTLSDARYTGAAEPALSLCRDLADLGYTTRFYSDSKRQGDLSAVASRRFGIEVETSLKLSVKSTPLEVFRDFLTLSRMVRTAGSLPLVIHCHASHDHAIARAALAGGGKGRTVALVRHLHSHGATKPGAARHWLWYGTAGAITSSRDVAEALVVNHSFPRDRILLLQNTVDAAMFHPDGPGRKEVRSSLGLPEDTFVLGNVARFRPGRGHKELVRMFNDRLAEHERIHLLLVGRGEEWDLVQRLCRGLGLQDRVHMPGFVEQTGLAEFYRAMDAFVLFREGSDAGCRAVIEAMACGLPVIGTKRAAMPELVRHGINGLLAPADDTNKLADLVLELYSDRSAGRQMGIAGRKMVESELDARARARRCSKFYESLFSLDGKGEAAAPRAL